MKGIAATTRTISAIRRADALPVEIPGGKMKKGVYPGGFGNSSYSGPFKLAITDTNKVTVRGTNSDPACDSYLIVDVGSASYLYGVSEAEITITVGGYICLDWWYQGGAWTHVVVFSQYCYPQSGDYGSYPAELERVSRQVLGKVTWDGSKISAISQWQYGIITARTRAY